MSTLRVMMLHQILANHRRQGIDPREMHANKHTLDSFAAEAKLVPVVPPDTRSPIERMMNRKEAPAPCLIFDGCTLVVNPRIMGQAILIRPAALMGDPDWLNKIQMHPHAHGPQGQQLIMPEGEETPWMERREGTNLSPEAERAGAALAPDDDVDVLAELNRGGNSKVTPSDVLIKSMEGMDKVEHVIVLRFYKNRDIDMASTMDRYAIQGGLHKAMAYVMGGE